MKILLELTAWSKVLMITTGISILHFKKGMKVKIVQIFAEEPRRDDKFEDDKVQNKLIVEVYNLNAKASNGISYEYRDDSKKHYIVTLSRDK